MFFTVPVTAKYLGVSSKHFYKQVLVSVISTIVLAFVGYGATFWIPNRGWGDFVLTVLIMLIIGFLIQFIAVFRKQERREIFDIIKRKFAAFRR